MTILEKVVELNPTLPDAYMLQGILHEQAFRYTEAMKSYRLALSHRKGWVAVTYRLTRILAAHPDAEQRGLDEANALKDYFIEIGAGGVPEILDTMAIVAAASGRWQEALELAEAAVESAKKSGNLDPVPEFMRRVELYRRQIPFVLPVSE